ncbi:helix-turn-helix transcriptional regulator [Bacillus toyonensis]|uniref:helix-turn-helix domain-containing protein n=1 Tax=Bacillus toyonensis TaxID=155322 RepID=UPI00163A847A|nr:helix-turn-helix transcriptional regulator [Bacillus toyonensis]
MSQEKLSFNSGLDRTYISLLERGKRKPTINTVFALANALNIKPSQLIEELENQVLDKKHKKKPNKNIFLFGFFFIL